MPELPEVEVMRRYFEVAAFDKQIDSVELYDDKMLKGDLEEFSEQYKKERFSRTERRGKFLFVSTKKTTSVIHFGMTGDLVLCSSTDDRPRFSRLAFVFKDGDRLHLLSLRKFGYIQPINDFKRYINKKGLGPDALGIGKREFCALFETKKTKLKPFLMDQKNLAGIGNWIADELLHRCSLHPEVPISKLQMDQKNLLHKELQKTLKAAIKFKTNKGNFPKKWFVNQRALDGVCPRCADEIIRLKVGGRSSYLCAGCQTF